MITKRNLFLSLGGVAVVVSAFFLTNAILNWLSPLVRSVDQSSPERTQNLILSSANFLSSNWKMYEAPKVEASAAVVPNGVKSVFKLIELSDGGAHYFGVFTGVNRLTSGNVYTFSIYFKPLERSAVLLEVRDDPHSKGGTNTCSVSNANVAGTSKYAGDVINGSIENVGGDWLRCSASMVFSMANGIVAIYLANPDGATKYQGDGHSGLLIGGAQFEIGDHVTAYTPSSIDLAKN